jgi:uncharacterized protein (TIGR02246 family)
MRSLSPSHSWLGFALLLIAVGPSLASGQGVKRPHTPLRYAADEIRDLREAYVDAFNKKDSETIAKMYSPDAILIRGNGSVLVGQEAIGRAFAKEAAHWPQMTVDSDSLRVVGHTAWETGTTRERQAGGGEATSHYLIVLRRGMKYWKINSLAVVPETSAADSASHR